MATEEPAANRGQLIEHRTRPTTEWGTYVFQCWDLGLGAGPQGVPCARCGEANRSVMLLDLRTITEAGVVTGHDRLALCRHCLAILATG